MAIGDSVSGMLQGLGPTNVRPAVGVVWLITFIAGQAAGGGGVNFHNQSVAFDDIFFSIAAGTSGFENIRLFIDNDTWLKAFNLNVADVSTWSGVIWKE